MKRNDLLWKATLEELFDDFLRFFYPEADELFDLNRGFEYLDKELEQLFPTDDENYAPRYVDKLVKEFTRLLSNEFAIVTTRYHEKIAIAQVTDGSKMRSMMINLSKMNSDNIGQLNYEKLPQLLLRQYYAFCF